MLDRFFIAVGRLGLHHHLGVVVAVLFTIGFLAVGSGFTVTSEAVGDIESVMHSLPAATPTQLRISSVDLDVSFSDPLGVTHTGEIEVPDDYETVGYYTHGPTPGELGPAVVLGHVDSYMGPAVFFSLKKVQVGDEIEIDRVDGSTAIFEVTQLEQHTQDGFPTELVYGDLDHAGLRLVTCTGVYNHGTQQYSHNLIVFARLKV